MKLGSLTALWYNKYVRGKYHSLIHAGEQEIPGMTMMSQWIFNDVLGYEVAELEKLKPEEKWLNSVIETLSNEHNYQEIKENNAGQPKMASLATIMLLSQIKQLYRQQYPKPLPNVQEMREKVKQLKLEATKDNSQQIQEEIEELVEAGKQAVQSWSEWSDQVLILATEGVQDKLEQIQQINGVLAGLGGEFSQGAEIELIHSITRQPQLLKLIKMVGQMVEVFNKNKRSQHHKGVEELVSVEYGNDLANILPSELMLLTKPTTKRIFQVKYLQNQLMQYEKTCEESLGKGDLVICLDTSSSMEDGGGLHCSKWLWAVSLTYALITLVQQQHRSVQVVLFNYQAKILENYQTLLNYRPSGGTDFNRALKFSIPLLNERCDLVFITDGECELTSSEQEEIKQELGNNHLYTILINDDYEEWSNDLITLSDEIMKVRMQELDQLIKSPELLAEEPLFITLTN
jgi:uncharacterized protein with von Willebrand factor type A (vWA) domain